MFCPNCGNELPNGARFCSECGASIPGRMNRNAQGAPDTRNAVPEAAAPADPPFPDGEQRISDNITLGADGKYRWTYEMSLFKNPTIFFLIWKIFFFVILGICAFMLLLNVIQGDFDLIPGTLKFLAYAVPGMTVLAALGYGLYAAIMGGKYIVDFEMDDEGVLHSQTPTQAKKAKKIGEITAVAGALSGRLSTVGAGMGAQRTEMYSEFARVKKIKAFPSRNIIKVNATLDHNQVFAAAEDFDFVYRFIADHCPNAKQG